MYLVVFKTDDFTKWFTTYKTYYLQCRIYQMANVNTSTTLVKAFFITKICHFKLVSTF